MGRALVSTSPIVRDLLVEIGSPAGNAKPRLTQLTFPPVCIGLTSSGAA
jgi:hypothetical protein